VLEGFPQVDSLSSEEVHFSADGVSTLAANDPVFLSQQLFRQRELNDLARDLNLLKSSELLVLRFKEID